jgi:hypothetical protein
MLQQKDVLTAGQNYLQLAPRAADEATTCSMNASQYRQLLDHTLNNQYLATALVECSAVCSRLILLGT